MGGGLQQPEGSGANGDGGVSCSPICRALWRTCWLNISVREICETAAGCLHNKAQVVLVPEDTIRRNHIKSKRRSNQSPATPRHRVPIKVENISLPEKYERQVTVDYHSKKLTIPGDKMAAIWWDPSVLLNVCCGKVLLTHVMCCVKLPELLLCVRKTCAGLNLIASCN